jgi:hypothetical protein
VLFQYAKTQWLNVKFKSWNRLPVLGWKEFVLLFAPDKGSNSAILGLLVSECLEPLFSQTIFVHIPLTFI